MWLKGHPSVQTKEQTAAGLTCWDGQLEQPVAYHEKNSPSNPGLRFFHFTSEADVFLKDDCLLFLVF